VQVCTGARLNGVEEAKGGLSVSFEMEGSVRHSTAEKVLVAVGRRPRTEALGLEALGIKTARGAVMTDEVFQTSVPGVYAVGDCNARLMLAHTAMAQGRAAGRALYGHKQHYNARVCQLAYILCGDLACVGHVRRAGPGHSESIF
jgi:dihydrolipoamide dehydrogenase